MNKSFFIAVLCFLVFVESHAQVSFSPGLRAGANFSKLTQTESSFKTDFYIGAIGALRLGRIYTLQPEITYTNQGANDVWLYDNNFYFDNSSPRSRTVSLSYVSVALINKLSLADNINFHLGPVFDIEAGKNYYSEIPIDIAFTAGLGYSITENLTIEGRIKKGIVDVLDSYYQYSNSPNIGSYNTNFLFQLGLSYTFAFQN